MNRFNFGDSVAAAQVPTNKPNPGAGPTSAVDKGDDWNLSAGGAADPEPKGARSRGLEPYTPPSPGILASVAGVARSIPWWVWALGVGGGAWVAYRKGKGKPVLPWRG